MNRTSGHDKDEKTFSQVDDNQDEFGRDVNDPGNKIGDKATVEKTKEDAHEASRKAGLQREHKRSDDQSDNVSGGFNQKH